MALLYRMGTGNGSGGDLKPYTVNFECANGYIGQTLTMTYQGTPHAGEVVDNVSGTVGSDGTLTLYPMHSGIWECSCYSSVTGKTMTKTIDLSYWGVQPTVTFEDTPNGATVTPTDDVQTWLHCANIWDKQYTIVSQVVADKTTLNALVQNENANDYLVRSTTFSTTLCENNANNEAMYYLGLYDGCAKKLLADDYWSNAICSADVLLADGQTHLFEKVLNVKVPTMTSNTAPSGEVINNINNEAYFSFNGVYSNDAGISKSFPHILGYKFVNKLIVKRMWVKNRITNPSMFKNFTIEGSDDGTNFTPIKTLVNTNNKSGYEQYFDLYENNKPYLYYRLNVTSNYSNFTSFGNIQFYGREEA